MTGKRKRWKRAKLSPNRRRTKWEKGDGKDETAKAPAAAQSGKVVRRKPRQHPSDVA
jgi:hypothetical protein